MNTRSYSTDSIASMSDEDLFGQIRSVKDYINRTRKNGQADNEAEVVFCYFVREVEIRQSRRDAHQQWLAKNRRR